MSTNIQAPASLSKSTSDQLASFLTWWYQEGRAMQPYPGEDTEVHIRRVAEMAWSQGVYAERNHALWPYDPPYRLVYDTSAAKPPIP